VSPEIRPAPDLPPAVLDLSAPVEPPAYEMKFLLAKGQGLEVAAWAQRHLPFDIHGDPALGYGYRTHTVYLDTPALDVYQRTGVCGRGKLRVRRYGTETALFLERKVRTEDRVRKRRTRVAADELALLDEDGADWSGEWFRQRQRERGLRPTLRMTYDRSAFVGVSHQGPLRLTLDHHLRVDRTADWLPRPVADGVPILTGGTILELKFHAALPALFKRLVEEFRLRPGAVSKYRLGMAAVGILG